MYTSERKTVVGLHNYDLRKYLPLHLDLTKSRLENYTLDNLTFFT